MYTGLFDQELVRVRPTSQAVCCWGTFTTDQKAYVIRMSEVVSE